MKKIIVCSFLLCLLITSCDKDYDSFNEDQEWGENDNGTNEPNEHGDHNDQIEGALTLYKVNGSKINKIKDYEVDKRLKKYQNNRELQEKLWEYVVNAIPSEQRTRIAQFELFHSEDLAGYVTPIHENDLSKWKFALSINLDGLDEEVNLENTVAYVTIHEFGHIFTLNENQVKVNQTDCATYHTGEGCSRANSYINKLYKIGWIDIIDEIDEYDPTLLYSKYPSRFHSEYAATNPGEDVAETFTYFILNEDKPSGKSIASKKEIMFYENKKAVRLRNQIRSRINPVQLRKIQSKGIVKFEKHSTLKK